MSDSSNLNDTFYKDLLTDQSSLVDVPHHDVPERHEFGGALLAPGIPSSIVTAAPSAGKSQAPARGDHVHGYTAPPTYTPPLDVTKLPRGWVASFATLNYVAPAANVQTALSNNLFWTPELNRRYAIHVNVRAIGPASPGGAITNARITIGGNAVPFIDHWWSGNSQFGCVTGSTYFIGDGVARNWAIYCSNHTVAMNVYTADCFIEDIGGV